MVLLINLQFFSELITTQLRDFHMVSPQVIFTLFINEGDWFIFNSRVYGAAKILMYSPSSGLYSCPLAMTDGAAKFFQVRQTKGSNIG